MNRLDVMADRLPAVYAIEEGTLLRQVLAVIGVELATLDEEMDRVQRSHWVRTAFTRADLERLGALVDVQAAPWETEDFFRSRLLALTAARLAGAVTWASIKGALLAILESAVSGLGLRLFALRTGDGSPRPFHGEPGADDPLGPAFIELPPRIRRSDDLIARRGLVRALDRFCVRNEGFRPAWLEGTVRGLAGGPTCVPLLINTRNGHAVGYAGRLRAGEELHLRAGAGGALTGRLTGLGRDMDVTTRLVTTREFPLDPKDPRAPLGRDESPTAIAIEPGDNTLRFVPLGLYDNAAFDKVLFAWPGPEMGQGVWHDAAHDGPGFDDAVFHTPEVASLDLSWVEANPAAFRVEIPIAAVRFEPLVSANSEAGLAQLLAVLDATAAQLRAAGVHSEVVGRPLHSVQTMSDGCRVGSVQLPPEPASAGIDAEIALNAVFSATSRRANRFA
jgi:hypothetical protein